MKKLWEHPETGIILCDRHGPRVRDPQEWIDVSDHRVQAHVEAYGSELECDECALRAAS
jgi:hypothetical protein